MLDYDYKYEVDYSTNTEYRECFRYVFRMDLEAIYENLKKIYKDFDDFEAETKDELMFDEPKVDKVMGQILEKTIDIPEFRELYLRAAGLVLSDIPDIGLSILLAYEFFKDFHKLLAEVFTYQETEHAFDDITVSELITDSLYFQNLRDYLSRYRR